MVVVVVVVVVVVLVQQEEFDARGNDPQHSPFEK